VQHHVLPRFTREATLAELAKLAVRDGWQGGRQGTGYARLALEERSLPALAKLLLAQSLLEVGEPPEGYWDCYLLRYAPGAFVPPHVDPPLVEGLVHVRMNLLVAAADEGGVLRLAGVEVPLAPGDAVVFRPDRDEHEVTRVSSGERLVWSVGCNLPAGRHAAGRREHGRGRRGCRCR